MISGSFSDAKVNQQNIPYVSNVQKVICVGVAFGRFERQWPNELRWWGFKLHISRRTCSRTTPDQNTLKAYTQTSN